MSASTAVSDKVRASPLVVMAAAGLGPAARTTGTVAERLEDLRHSFAGYMLAVDGAGVIGCRLLQLAVTHGGRMTDEELRFQTGRADMALVADELKRLIDAGLVEMLPEGEIRVPDALMDHMAPVPSMADNQALSSDELRVICRRLGISTPPRKGERIASIAAHFRRDDGRKLVLKDLSPASRKLLDAIAKLTPRGVVDAAQLGLGWAEMNSARSVLSRYAATRPGRPPGPLHALVEKGIVGVSEWAGTVWLWREALALVERPFFDDWKVAPRPSEVPCGDDGNRFPPIVSLVDGAIRHWSERPPNVLKNGERRLAKAAVRTAAKALDSPVELVELAADLVLDIGLLLPNVVSASGRGRNRQLDQVWLPDPALLEAWSHLTAPQKWARLVAAWSRPTETDEQQQLQWNRHLVLWELGDLEPGVGFDGDERFANWLEDRYATICIDMAVICVLMEMRSLGLLAASGPVGLTGPGRLVLTDPAAAIDALAGSETTVIVQGDLTILAPPGLDPEVRARLDELAVHESGDAAQLLRLDETRIIRAVQAGRSAEDIVAFLIEVSSVPLVDAVVRLVHDAARRAGQVRLVPAASVVVVDDPADLRLACSAKAAKLEPLSDTVAVSPLPLDKVRSALERKGLAPSSAVSAVATGRSAEDEVAELRDRAARHRQLAERHGHEGIRSRASALEQRADELADSGRRLQVAGPLAVTPEIATSLVAND